MKQIPCWLDKKKYRGGKHYASIKNQRLGGYGTKIASTITSRYYMGVMADRDNCVLEVWIK